MKKLNKTELARMIVRHAWYKPWEKIDEEKEIAMLINKHSRAYLEEWVNDGYDIVIDKKTHKKIFADISKRIVYAR